MKINSSQLLLSSQHHLSRKKVVNESLVEGISRSGKRWSADNLQQGMSFQRREVSLYNQYGFQQSSFNQQPLLRPASTHLSDLSNSPGRHSSVPEMHLPQPLTGLVNAPQIPAEVASTEVSTSAEQLDARMQLMITMVEAITGKKVNILNTNFLSVQSSHSQSTTISETTSVDSSVGEYGMRYHYSEETIETETTSFNAQAKVLTSDGRSFEIDFEMNMSRTFIQRHQVDIAAGAARLKDPLVINFDGDGSKLRNEKIQFDLDADGIDDNISFVSANNGLLALDKNRDGIINNGAELFGALNGNGFAELALHDNDNNQLIDEVDAIFELLKIWVKDENGNDTLYTLAEANVGAIFLGSTATPFELKDQANELLGAIRSSGIYLTEDGEARSMQQLDLVV